MLVKANHAQIGLVEKNDIEGIRRHILHAIDCQKTLEKDENGNSISEKTLLDENSGVCLTPKELRDRSRVAKELKFKLRDKNGYELGTFGKLTPTIRCDNKNHTLLVSLSHKGEPQFLFGNGEKARLCQSELGGNNDGTDKEGTKSCPAGQQVVAIDFSKQTVTCESVDPCAGDPIVKFVRRLYHDVLQRPASPTNQEIAYWTGEYNKAFATGGEQAARKAVAAGFMNSPPQEFRNLLLNEWYNNFLKRAPTSSERSNGLSHFGSSFDYAKIYGKEIGGGSPSVNANGGTCRSVISAMYQNILHRDPTSSDLAYWAPLCHSNGTGWVGERIAGSREAHEVLVRGWYIRYLRREAEPGGLRFWSDALDRGETYGDTLAGILASGEYFNRCF